MAASALSPRPNGNRVSSGHSWEGQSSRSNEATSRLRSVSFHRNHTATVRSQVENPSASCVDNEYSQPPRNSHLSAYPGEQQGAPRPAGRAGPVLSSWSRDVPKATVLVQREKGDPRGQGIKPPTCQQVTSGLWGDSIFTDLSCPCRGLGRSSREKNALGRMSLTQPRCDLMGLFPCRAARAG